MGYYVRNEVEKKVTIALIRHKIEEYDTYKNLIMKRSFHQENVPKHLYSRKENHNCLNEEQNDKKNCVN